MMIFRKALLLSVTSLFIISCASVPLNATSDVSQRAVERKEQTPARIERPVTTEAVNQSVRPKPRSTVIARSEMIEDPLPAAVPEAKGKRETTSAKKSDANNHQSVEDLQEQQEALDQALELLNQSQGFWQKGDIDNSLRCLDEAYALILEVNGDPEIARQKDDLRLIISKRIVEISTTKHTVAKGKQSEIPLVMNADVEREIRSFQTVERGFFLRSYQRSGQYRPIILKYLQEAGLPKELSWLPLVESGFQSSVLSRARALGLWQFIPSTGYKYALQRDRWVDERMDAEKSTKAAIAYLKELHDIFGDWMTCLAAYNCGEGRVLRVISKQHINYLDHFWDLYRQLPNETARYVPRFLATLYIIRDPKKYDMDLSEDPDRPIPYETVKIEKCMRLQDVAQHANIPKETLTALNAELKLQLTPDKPYDLKVPSGAAKVVLACLEDIPKWEAPRPTGSSRGSVLVRHKVKKGESLKGIARRYKTTVADIVEYNELTGKTVSVGQVIRVPARGYAKSSETKTSETKRKATGKKTKKQEAETPQEKVISYKVKKGDSISAVAKRYGTSSSEIRKLNNLKGDQLNVNQVIKIKDNS